MPAVVEEFNPDRDRAARLFWNGDVSTAYDTEAGRRLVWQWWLMEKMANWASALNSVKPFYSPAYWDPRLANDTSLTPTKPIRIGFVVRAAANEEGVVADGGMGFPAHLVSIGNSIKSGWVCRLRPGESWDDWPESTEYPGWHESVLNLFSDSRIEDEDKRIQYDSPNELDDSHDVASSPGYDSDGVPTVVYSTTPGEEFFLFYLPFRGPQTGVYFPSEVVWGIHRIQNMSQNIKNNTTLQAGWSTFFQSNTNERYESIPLHNGRIARTSGADVGSFVHQPAWILDNQGQTERYFSGIANTQWREVANNARGRVGMQFYTEQGLPFGDCGNMILTLSGPLYGKDRSYRMGRAMSTQIEYNGNIYLCICPSYFWKIS